MVITQKKVKWKNVSNLLTYPLFKCYFPFIKPLELFDFPFSLINLGNFVSELKLKQKKIITLELDDSVVIRTKAILRVIVKIKYE